MSAWDDSLHPAAWRDIPFHAVNAPCELGRRVAIHEYPLREEPETQDLGRKIRKYNFEAFLLGDDALAQRDKFETALDKSGEGILVHPYYGSIRAQLIDARPIYKANKRRKVGYSLSFVEAGKKQFPLSETDTLTAVEKAVDEGLNAVKNSFEKDFITKGPDFLDSSAQGWLNKGLDGVRSINGRITELTAPIDEAARTIDAIGSELATLILQPGALATKVTGLIRTVFGLGGDIQRALDGYKHLGLTVGSFGAIPKTTPSRLQQDKNRLAIGTLFVTTATLEAARSVAIASRAKDVTTVKSIGVLANASASSSPFTSYQNAIAVRDELLVALDVIALTASDELYIAIRDTQAQLQSHITAHGAKLQRIRNHQLVVTQPSLVLAHNLYGDATRDDEINVRNSVPHPGFLNAGVDLEVLND
jgi:prophage DNA circulation protein